MKDRMFKVIYKNHDKGCADGFMVRESWISAEQAARLMQERGYMVTIEEIVI